MKRLLVLSLILNLVLLGATLGGPRHKSPAGFARPLRTHADAPATFNSPKHKPPVTVPQATAWQAIESGEPAKFVANLRAIGCPEQTIRDIVVTRVSREFHGRLMSAYADDARRQPWWRGRSPSRESVDLSQLRLSLRGQRDDLLEEHFGESAYRLTFQILGRPGGIAAGRVYLPADKRRALRELDSLYARLSAELTFPIGEAVGDDEQAALKDLRRRKRADLEALLSSQELGELDLRESAAARYVLRKLPQALSEADFRLMVRAAREAGIPGDTEAASVALARRYGLGPRNESGQSGQQDQQAFIEARIRELLGEQRFAQWQQAEAARSAAAQGR